MNIKMLIEIIKGTGNFGEQEVYTLNKDGKYMATKIDKESLKIYLNKLVDEL